LRLVKESQLEFLHPIHLAKMKLFLAILCFVGAAISNSTYPYAWTPEREFVFRYESKVDFSIPEIRTNQKAGLRLNSLIRIQAKQDFSLLITFENPRFLTFNGLQDERREEREQPIPPFLKMHLETPFKAHLRRGIVEAIFVHHEEPVAITNIKKAVLANLNMDLDATRQSEVLSNHIEVQDITLKHLDQPYFTVREQSLHGDCETSYTVYPLPEYEALEIESQMEEEEQRRNQQEPVQGGLSQAREVCQGRKYWQIKKTRNFDNCIERPVFQKWTGVKANCDATMSACENVLTHVSSTTYIVCGNDIRDFVIRKSATTNAMSSGLGWKTEEKLFNQAVVVLELLKEQPITTPLQIPANVRKITHLIFEYPAESVTGHQSLNEEMSLKEKTKVEQESGVRPILPMPDLVSAPKMLVAINMDRDVIAHQVIEQLRRVATEMFETPESCTSKSDVAGHLNMITRALRPLSLQNLKHVEALLEAQITALTLEQKTTMRHLFYEVVSMIGTNPAVMFVKEKLLKVDNLMALKMVQNTVANIKTPTQGLIFELIRFVKTELQPSHEHTELTHVYNVILVQLSNLINRACIDPIKANRFPEKIYGPFCERDSPVVLEWATLLEQELETEQNRHIKLNIITALGKLGHIRSVQALAKVISHPHYNEMVRSLAVYSLKRAAKFEPAVVRPILLTIIDNSAEYPEVRIAAVSVLPYAQPTIAELQKIAVMTWFEPSREVASFIYSTFKYLAATEVPELKAFGVMVKSLMTFVKPHIYGYHYSKNLHITSFVRYLNYFVSNEFSWTKSPMSVVPARMSWNTQLYGMAEQLDDSRWTIYTRGMDKYIDIIMAYTNQFAQPSKHVEEQLTEIIRELNIGKRLFNSPEMFMQGGFLGFEEEMYLSEATVVDALKQVSEIVNQDAQSLSLKRNFEVTRVAKLLEAEVFGPTDAGFPIFSERVVPFVLAVKGYGQMEIEERNSVKIPKMIRAKVVPVMNWKFQANIGVVSPFTYELIGAGFEMAGHYATPLEMTVSQNVKSLTVNVKIPEEVKTEMEAIHAFTRPYTVRKDLRKIEPISKSTDIKVIVSGEPLKKVNLNIGEALEVDAKLIGVTDAKYTDLYSYWELIRQQSVFSTFNSVCWMPSTLRMGSAKILFNPQTSKTKEFSLNLGFAMVKKDNNHLVKMIPSNVEPIVEAISQKTMEELSNDGTVVALKIGAELKSQSGPHKSVHTALSFGLKKVSSGSSTDYFKVVSNLEVKSFQYPIYEVMFASTIDIPRILNRWNKEQMIRDNLKMLFNGQIQYGFENTPKQVVKIFTAMVKSEEQKQAIMQSPEFQRCSLLEQQGHPLAEVCELTRHQATSIDQIQAELTMPMEITRFPIFIKVGEILRAYFIGQLRTEVSSYTPANSMKMMARVSRTGEEAQLEAEIAGMKYMITNLRMPKALKGLIPVSIRNPIRYNLVQKISQNMLPASCRVEAKHISTFDNKTYAYQLNNCYHLLYKDCSERMPVAVLARTIDLPRALGKEVRILAGPAEVLLTPAYGFRIRVGMNVDGHEEEIKVQPGQVMPIMFKGQKILEVKSFKDNVYLVKAVREGLWVLFDGQNVEVSGTYLLNSRVCGLCGDLNGEKIADLKTPRQCVMSHPRFAAYSYMIPRSCSGIPTQDRPQYELEKTRCVREEFIPTPLEI